jgi:hypothetical protein
MFSGTTNIGNSNVSQNSSGTQVTLGSSGAAISIGTAGFTSNGTLNLPAATNTAGGIYFGTDSVLYRTGSGALRVNSSFTIDSTLTSSGLITSDSGITIRSANLLNFNNSGNTKLSSFGAGAQTATINYTMPVAAPASNQILRAGTVSGTDPVTVPLEWVTPSASGVTSVGLSLPGIFTVSGSPVTGSGTLSATLASQSQNLIFASPDGASGAPSFRSFVNADLPTSGATAGSYTFASLTVNAQGIVTSVSNGTAPVTTLITLTGATQSFATGTTGTNFNISSVGTTHTFNIPDASAANRGLITTGTQTIAGAKTFSSDLVCSASIEAGTGTFSANKARMYYDGTIGTVFTARNGTTYNIAFANSAGSIIFANPTGTSDFSIINGSITVSQNATITGFIQWSGGTFSSGQNRLYHDGSLGAVVATSRTGSTNDATWIAANGFVLWRNPTGTRNIEIVNGSLAMASANEIRFWNSGNTFYSSIKNGATSAQINYTLPVAQPTTNQVLTATVISGAGPYAVTFGWTTPVLTSGDQTITGVKTFSNPIVGSARISSGVVALTDGATIALDASLGNHFRVTLGGNRTLDIPSNPVDGQKIMIEVIQDATGSRTLTLTTGSSGSFAYGTDITTITLSTAANARDFIGAVYNSTAQRWYVIAFIKGY